MKGAEHYTEAENRLHQAHNEGDPAFSAYLVAKAQAHATLALAAATIETAACQWPMPSEWIKAVR